MGGDRSMAELQCHVLHSPNPLATTTKPPAQVECMSCSLSPAGCKCSVSLPPGGSAPTTMARVVTPSNFCFHFPTMGPKHNPPRFPRARESQSNPSVHSRSTTPHQLTENCQVLRSKVIASRTWSHIQHFSPTEPIEATTPAGACPLPALRPERLRPSTPHKPGRCLRRQSCRAVA